MIHLQIRMVVDLENFRHVAYEGEDKSYKVIIDKNSYVNFIS